MTKLKPITELTDEEIMEMEPGKLLDFYAAQVMPGVEEGPGYLYREAQADREISRNIAWLTCSFGSTHAAVVADPIRFLHVEREFQVSREDGAAFRCLMHLIAEHNAAMDYDSDDGNGRFAIETDLHIATSDDPRLSIACVAALTARTKVMEKRAPDQ